ncbi:hypothetical protein B0H16DRAFT_1835495 [Mycena metata]|uniref:Uncharacterized protein n=1 Tax=Mycena metata TaxID=1033252 RepID=A0AAD7DWS7_9AGAR|nr:hypothetical protein B0H16DRAFT_1835495 [Mycena metata]
MLAFKDLMLVALAGAVASLAMPSLPAASTVEVHMPVDIKIATTRASYAVHVNSTGAASPNATSDYIDLFDTQSAHIGRYTAAEFFAAASGDSGENCNALSAAQVQLMRGWTVLRDQPFSWDGRIYSGVRNVWTANEGGIQLASSCTGPGPFTIIGGEPTCSEYLQTVRGESKGNTGAVTATFSTGTASSLTLTTTKSSELSVGVTVEVGVQIKIFSASTSVTRTETVKNENSKSTQDTISVQNSLEIIMDPPTLNSNCELKLCHQHSSGILKVPFIATGWIAVDFCTDGFPPFFCATWSIGYLSIDANLPDVKLRSSEMEVRGSTQGTLNGAYVKHCT